MLKLYPSNRLERLAERLAKVTAVPLRDPFTTEIVVTQSLGMAHWLSLQLAQRNGIAANIRFLLPAALVWELFRLESDEPLSEQSVFGREALTWRILDRLPHCLADPAFAALRTYLAGDHAELKRYQLACRVADLFDQYLVFRPALIESWDAGAEPDDWQAELWRALSGDTAEAHRAILLRRFLERCDEGRLSAEALPERISVFGVCTLPPAHLEVLSRVGEWIDVHVFFFNPCQEYWGDLSDERAAARWRRWRKRDSEFMASGHPLLSSLGQQGRDFFERLLDVPIVEPIEGDELFEDPGPDTLLTRLQSDILNRIDRRLAGEKQPLLPGDDSVRLHVCHTPMREVEVLHDQLLALFDRHADLEPRDVVVMAPEIESYAPFIEAVFGARSEDGPLVNGSSAPRLPYSIADRAAKHEHPLLQTFLSLLQLPVSRLKASEVLALLQAPAIRRRYRISEEEYEHIHLWIRGSGIRWGFDAKHRERLGLPERTQYTWEFGLDRLFLGYALAPTVPLYEGLAPFEDIEGQVAEGLGKLASLLHDLVQTGAELGDALSPPEWAARLNGVFDRFFALNEDSMAVAQSLRDALADLQEETAHAGFEGVLDRDIVMEWLQGRLAQPGKAQRFSTGQVTFCSLLPMRNVPFRVVCLLGMNDVDFPRRRKHLGFDRIAQDPLPGDRSRREDDRYLFLEVLLSARQYFYISYVGRQIRDNSTLLPSVVVSELMDCIDQRTAWPEGTSTTPADSLIREHPMQPFNARYFAPASGLFSYAAEWVPASTRSIRPRSSGIPFAETSIGTPDDSFLQVHIEQLIRFYRNPTRYFLEQRLALFAGEEAPTAEDCEPFALDGLQHFGIKQELLAAELHSEGTRTHGRHLAARGLLPEPPFDVLALEQDQAAIAALLAKVHEQYGEYLQQPFEPLPFDLALDPFRFYGTLRELYAPGLLLLRSARLKAKDRINLWIRHLALHAIEPDTRGISVVVAEDMDITLTSLDRETARAHLRNLLQIYWTGLSVPLRFFPETSFAYAAALASGGDAAKAQNAADKRWTGSDYATGEGQDAAYGLAFRTGFRLFDPPFEDLALSVFAPLLENSAT